jgi:acyl-CoA synthetase (AMP-forming)/AMP-acid ligase II
MISHHNVIASVLQLATFESKFRQSHIASGNRATTAEVSLGLLPQSHIYSLVTVCHTGLFRGDQVIVLSRFDLNQLLYAVQKFRIMNLYLVGFWLWSYFRREEQLLKACGAGSTNCNYDGTEQGHL